MYTEIVMRNVLIIVFLLLSGSSIAQKFHKGKLLFVDGKTIDAFVEIPKDPGDKNINYKIKETDQKISVASEQLKSVSIMVDDSTQYEFSREIAKKPVSKTKFRTMEPAWLTVLEKGAATLYATGEAFKVNRHGALVIRGNWRGGMPPDTNFFLKRPGEENAMWVAFYSPATVGLDVTFRYWTEQYFSDYPELAKRIKSKEFKVLQISEVVRIYNAWKANSK